MRTEQEMFDLILNFAKQDQRVRVVAMNGSRANPNIKPDIYQDFDIVYIVTEMASFLSDDAWLDYFGKRIIMQKPEGMELFPPDGKPRFSYLMLFEDGNRIDLSLLPLEELEQYLKEDSIIRILLDKDGRMPAPPQSSDVDYWIKRPTSGMFDYCCNEFWWLSTYVAKGLARNELPYAIAHLDYMRKQLMTMLSCQLGFEKGFNFSIGKDYKYLQQHLDPENWQALLNTWQMDNAGNTWQSMFMACNLFCRVSNKVSFKLSCPLKGYDRSVTNYLTEVFRCN